MANTHYGIPPLLFQTNRSIYILLMFRHSLFVDALLVARSFSTRDFVLRFVFEIFSQVCRLVQVQVEDLQIFFRLTLYAVYLPCALVSGTKSS